MITMICELFLLLLLEMFGISLLYEQQDANQSYGVFHTSKHLMNVKHA
jgi:hypothetical protein